jgi:hypothetical protein
MEQTHKKKTAKPYSPDLRERAVRLAMEHRDEYHSEAAALTAIAGKLGCSPDSRSVLGPASPAGWRRLSRPDECREGADQGVEARGA